MNKRINKRKEKDINKLKDIVKDVTIINNNIITLSIQGPIDSDYEHGTWQIKITIPPNYPFVSPSVGFIDKIYHPNIDLRSGSICLNTLNETWTPIYNLSHIYNIFIPQLLLYPNPEDPLNEEAARLFKENQIVYKENINKYIKYFV
tara:strand:+ start:2638 stop:3078 length:441 start_codon:yes stop_codon:yes gene_type:complete